TVDGLRREATGAVDVEVERDAFGRNLSLRHRDVEGRVLVALRARPAVVVEREPAAAEEVRRRALLVQREAYGAAQHDVVLVVALAHQLADELGRGPVEGALHPREQLARGVAGRE